MCDTCNCRDRSGNEKGVPQIEVTPEMIEAGFQVLRASGLAEDYLETDKRMVAEIYCAMHGSRSCLDAGQTKTK